MTITNNGLIPTGMRMQEMISQEIRLLITDSTNLRNTPFIDFVGSINGSGSQTIRVRKAGLDGYDSFTDFAPANEDDAVVDSALTSSYVDVVVKRKAMSRSITDLANLTGLGGGDIDPFRIAEDIARSYETLFADLTAQTVANFTVSKGTTGAVLTVDGFIDAFQALEQAASFKGASGPYVALLHPKQWADLQDDIRGESNNALAFAPASFEAMAAKGDHYKGTFMGVEIYVSSHITTDGGDYQGAMFAAGALGYATGMPQGLVGSAEQMEMGEVLVEMERDATKALTRVIGHAYLGMSVIDNDRGVNLISVA